MEQKVIYRNFLKHLKGSMNLLYHVMLLSALKLKLLIQKVIQSVMQRIYLKLHYLQSISVGNP